MYIVVYNTDSNEKRLRLESELLRRFPLGASIKEGVYLLPEQNGINIRGIIDVIDTKLSSGDTIYISQLGHTRAYRGFPKRFRDWIQDKQ